MFYMFLEHNLRSFKYVIDSGFDCSRPVESYLDCSRPVESGLDYSRPVICFRYF